MVPSKAQNVVFIMFWKMQFLSHFKAELSHSNNITRVAQAFLTLLSIPESVKTKDTPILFAHI